MTGSYALTGSVLVIDNLHHREGATHYRERSSGKKISGRQLLRFLKAVFVFFRVGRPVGVMKGHPLRR